MAMCPQQKETGHQQCFSALFSLVVTLVMGGLTLSAAGCGGGGADSGSTASASVSEPSAPPTPPPRSNPVTPPGGRSSSTPVVPPASQPAPLTLGEMGTEDQGNSVAAQENQPSMPEMDLGIPPSTEVMQAVTGFGSMVMGMFSSPMGPTEPVPAELQAEMNFVLIAQANAIHHMLQQSQVVVTTQSESGNLQSPGFLVDRQGTILTGSEFLSGARGANCQFANGSSAEINGIKHYDPAANFAALQASLSSPEIRPLRLGNSRPRKGDLIVEILGANSSGMPDEMSGSLGMSGEGMGAAEPMNPGMPAGMPASMDEMGEMNAAGAASPAALASLNRLVAGGALLRNVSEAVADKETSGQHMLSVEQFPTPSPQQIAGTMEKMPPGELATLLKSFKLPSLFILSNRLLFDSTGNLVAVVTVNRKPSPDSNQEQLVFTSARDFVNEISSAAVEPLDPAKLQGLTMDLQFAKAKNLEGTPKGNQLLKDLKAVNLEILYKNEQFDQSGQSQALLRMLAEQTINKAEIRVNNGEKDPALPTVIVTVDVKEPRDLASGAYRVMVGAILVAQDPEEMSGNNMVKIWTANETEIGAVNLQTLSSGQLTRNMRLEVTKFFNKFRAARSKASRATGS